jgi:hypothetical protein
MLMNARKTILAAAVALTAGAVGFTGVAPSYAGAMNNAAPIEKSGWSGNGVEQVKHRRGHYKKKYKNKRWSYNRSRHGKRWRHRHRGYSHYYDGYWYPRPFWRSEPGIYLHLDL